MAMLKNLLLYFAKGTHIKNFVAQKFPNSYNLWYVRIAFFRKILKL